MKKILLLVAFISTLILTSCSGDGESGSKVTSITLTSNSTEAYVNDPLTFIVKDNNNQVITSESKIYVNGTLISGDTFTPTSTGNLTVYATFNEGSDVITSETLNFTSNNSINFNKRLLIEDFTGTWCQYCPRVAYAIDLVKAQTSDVNVVAIHRGNDPYNFTDATPLESFINLVGYPTAMLNRKTEWTYPETSTGSINQALALTTGINPKLGIAMTTTTTGSTSNIQVKVKFGKNFSNLKLVVYAVEDNLIYNQTNSTSYYGGGNPLVGFEHNHVARAVLTGSILGDIITGTLAYETEYTRNFVYNAPSNVNPANIHFVAIILDSTNNAVNSRTVSNTETQSYEVE